MKEIGTVNLGIMLHRLLHLKGMKKLELNLFNKHYRLEKFMSLTVKKEQSDLQRAVGKKEKIKEKP